jgi:hypothetical protein
MIVYENHVSPKEEVEYTARGWFPTDKPTITRRDFGNPDPEATVECKIWRIEKYVGATFCTRERNWSDDSDFYAVCWDEKSGCMIEEEYDTTRFGGGGWANVDATDEVKVKAAKWLEGWLEATAWEEYEQSKNYIRKDKQVRLVTGRPKFQDTGEKVALGTLGTVVWYGEGRDFSRYGHGLIPMRALVVKAGGESFWTNARNLDVVNPDQYLPTREEVVARCHNIVLKVLQSNSGWHIPFAYGRGLFVV